MLEVPTLAIRDVRVYSGPDSDPVDSCTVLIEHGAIAKVEPHLHVPDGARVLEGKGRTLLAGFWNAHVHLTERFWSSARGQPAVALNPHLADMFTSRGFTTVVDTGSDPRITLSVRRRIETGELAGPRIYTSGTGLYPPNGIPYYLRRSLPWYAPWFMPQPRSPGAARKAVLRNIARGTDLVKLFTGSYAEPGRVLAMPEPVARAAVEVAHAHHQLVFSHPSNREGTLVALRSGVDVLAHAPDTTEGVDPSLLRGLADRGVAMVPTLKMFATTVSKSDSYLAPIYSVIREFRDAGGDLMFGTDVGYMTDYSTAEEFEALAAAGLGWRELLRMLTTTPARHFRVEKDKGRVLPGQSADLVLLDGDPASDVRAFSRVHTTIRGGQVLWNQS